MQITIDVAEILGDPDKARDEIIQLASAQIVESMREQTHKAINKVVDEQLKLVVPERLKEVFESVIDAQFSEVDSYGRVGKERSIRDRILTYLQKNCEIKNSNYSSDLNVFTRVVQKTVEEEVTKFKKEFESLVNKKFVEDTLEFAVKRLRESMAIK